MTNNESEQNQSKVGSRRLVAAKMVMLDAPYGAGLGSQLKVLESMSDAQVFVLNTTIDEEAKNRLK